MEATLIKVAMLALLVLGALPGCSATMEPDPHAWINFSPPAQCERHGGYWNRTAGVCEAPFPR